MRRTEMNDAGQIDRKIDRKADRRIDRATTSLTPYGMSFWALILAACGGGGGGGGGPQTSNSQSQEQPAPQPQQQPDPQPQQAAMVQRTGHVYDGPIRGAVVYMDVNGDGALDSGDEFVGVTDSTGRFSGSISVVNADKRYLVDFRAALDLGDDGIEGTDDDRELSRFDVWLAPKGANVISALTHMIAQNTMTPEIQQVLDQRFPNFDPLQHNPFGETENEALRAEFQQLRQFLPMLTDIVDKNRDLIEENARKIKGLETTVTNLEAKVGALQTTIQQLISGANPAVSETSGLTPDLDETTASVAADTGLRFSVTDADGNFTGSPTVSDERFELRRSGSEWQLWVKAGQSFTSGERVSLTITATDVTNRRDEEEVTFTIGDVEHDPVLEVRNAANLREGNLRLDTDTGVTFTVADADSGESGFVAPVVAISGDARFKAVANEAVGYSIVARNGAAFTSGDRITLTITATDGNNSGRTDVETVTFTVADVEHDPALQKSGKFTLKLTATTASVAADTGLRFGVTDADGNFTGPPTLSDDRFELKRSGDHWELWVRAEKTFSENESIILTVTATDSVDRFDRERMVFQVLAAEQASEQPTAPESPTDLPAQLTLGKANPNATQLRINETPDSSYNDSPVFTGFVLVVSRSGAYLPNFFVDVRNRELTVALPDYEIERKLSDGTYVAEDRFTIRQNGKLSVKADTQMNFESEDNSNGLIELRITIRDASGDEARFNVNIQLSDVNESPTGETALYIGTGDNKTIYDTNPRTAPRLPVGTVFSIDEDGFSDPDTDDELTFTYTWIALNGRDRGQRWNSETFTPNEPGLYAFSVTISDGEISLQRHGEFRVYAETPIVDNPAFENDLNVTIAENTTPDEALMSIDLDHNGGRITGEYYIVSINGRPADLPGRTNLPFVLKTSSDGNSVGLWLREGVTLDHELMVPVADLRSTELEQRTEHVVVLRHDNFGGIRYADVTFKLTVTDVEESPGITFRGNDQSFDLAANALDTGGRVAINDPDITSTNGAINHTLSDNRFELEQDNSFPWLGPPTGSAYYKIVAKAGQTFTPGEIITLTITATDHNGNANNTTATVTITILPATSGQSSGQGGGRAMTEVVSPDDFSPDAGVEELGAPLAEVL